MKKPLIISYYLPQYHPFKENDEWWGKGFTEWTNVVKAKKYYPGQYQPKLPGELGFYDLRIPEVREEQVLLAKEAGIDGFCYWHYWFNGHKLMERPFEEVVKSGNPDFPFCLNWANHSWYAKSWNKETKDNLLIEQTYGGDDEYVAHFKDLLEAFKDSRYMKVDGKLLFGIYDPFGFTDIRRFMDLWNQLALENGLKGFHFFCHAFKEKDVERLKEMGFETIMLAFGFKRETLSRYLYLFFNKIGLLPQLINYRDYAETVVRNFVDRENCTLQIVPNWDHTPRSGRKGSVYFNTCPDEFQKLLQSVFNKGSKFRHTPPFYMIKSWNEWGEGNYMEPDARYGKGYIIALRNAIDSCFKK